MRNTTILTFIMLIACLTADAQLFCRMRTFEPDGGIQQAHISNVQKDKTGFIWFATWNGLVRFDGYTFYTFKPIQNSGGTIHSNRIYNLKTSSTGNIWCVSSDNRLYLFDTTMKTFTDVMKDIAPVADKKVKMMQSMPKGVTWVVFKDGSCLRLADADHRHGWKFYAAGSTAAMGKKVYETIQDENGDEWITTDRGTVCPTRNIAVKGDYRFFKNTGDRVFLISKDGKMAIIDRNNRIKHGRLPSYVKDIRHSTLIAKRHIAMALDKGTAVYDTKTGKCSMFKAQGGDNIIYLYGDSKNRLWAFAQGEAVYLIDIYAGTASRLASEPAPQSQGMKNPQLIFEDGNGNIILKPAKGKLAYYDDATRTLRQPEAYRGNEPATFDPEKINKFMVDSRGNLWVIQPYETTCLAFFNKRFAHRDSDGRTEVRAQMKDSKGRHWHADRNNHIYITGRGGGNRLYLSATGTIQASPCTFSKMPVYCMSEDRDRRIWIGTKGEGVYVLSPEGGKAEHYKVTHLTRNGNGRMSINSDSIYAIYQDRRGYVWLGSYGNGLCRTLTPHTGVQGFVTVGSGKGFNKIRCITESKDGTLIAGTTDGILTVDTRGKGTPKTYRNSFRNEPWGLKGNDIMKILHAGGRIYACVYGSGISEIVSGNLLSDSLHFRNHMITTQSTADQIMTATVHGKDIWLASEQAISRFSTTSGTFSVFGRSMFAGSFNFSEATPITDGNEITFGTSEGTLTFNANDVRTTRGRQNIVFTGIQYQNDMSIHPLNDIRELTISPDERSFSLYMSSLDCMNNGETRYRYILEGYDNGWNYTDEHQHSANYTGIPDGDYTLRVEAAGADGVWNSNERTLAIHVTPLFTETIWFKMLVCIIVMAIFAAMVYAIIYLNRMRRIVQNKYSLLMTIDSIPAKNKEEERQETDGKDDTQEFIRQSVEFFNSNIANKNLVIEDFARHLNMSRTAYYNKMKAATGLSPVDFIKQMRIKTALKLLDEGKLSVTDVAYRTGFSDPKYFARCFKAEMDMTPTQYLNGKKNV